MILDGCHFQYGGFNSRDYGLIFAHIDTQSFDNLFNSPTNSYLFNKKENARHLIGSQYSESPLSFEAEITTCNAWCIPESDRRTIEKSLFRSSGYQKLYMDVEDDKFGESYDIIDGQIKRLYLNCYFVNPVKIEHGDGVIGYKFNIECDSNMFWQDEMEFVYDVPQGGVPTEGIRIMVDTDSSDYIYPELTIQMGGTGGDISIVNKSDSMSRMTSFVGVPQSSSIIMNGDINYVSGNYYEKFSNQNFLRLFGGENRLGITGDVKSIKVKWQNRRFL